MVLLDYIFNNPQSLCFLDRTKVTIDFEKHFQFIIENSDLRIKSEKVNYLFRNISTENFKNTFHKYYQRLNLNFAPVICSDKKSFQLSTEQQIALCDKIILDMMYIHNKGVGQWNPKWWHYYGAFEAIRATYYMLEPIIKNESEIYYVGAIITRQKEKDFRHHIESIKLLAEL